MGVEKEEIKKYKKEYYLKNREKILEQKKQYRKDNHEKISEKRKIHYSNNREKMREYKKQYRKDNLEKMRERDKKPRNQLKRKNSQLLHHYKLSYEDWLKMWEKQDGRCAICNIGFTKPSEAYVDHNHKTDKVRGLLCMKCNFGIGSFSDDPTVTAKATEYLLRNK